MPEIFNASKDVKKTKAETESASKPDKRRQHKNGSLSAFMVHPTDVHFETQEASEEIELLMRRHPITNLSWVITTLVLILLPIFFGIIFFPLIRTITIPPVYFIVLPIIWYLGVWGYVFASFLHWYFNVYIVTNQRVVDIDWVSLLYRQHSSTLLSKIQDVTYKQGGILDSFFNFGNVFIQTAGSEPNFEFHAVPLPEAVVREINQIIQKNREPAGSI